MQAYLKRNGILNSLDFATTAKIDFIEAFDQCILPPRGFRYKYQFTEPTGTDAVEAAIKLARLATNRSTIIACKGSFHGVTLGSLSATASEYSNLAQGKSGGMPKWGYNRNEVTGFYEPDQIFGIIRQGFDMHLEGYSQRDIIDFWRQNDVHRMTKINRKNKNKRKITVYNSVSILGSILGDPFYYGILVQGGQKVDLREILPDFKPMITEEEFGLIRAKRRNLKKVVSASVKDEEGKVFIPFRQMVKCGECGNFIHVARSKSRTSKKYLYFRCGNPECTRKQKNIRAQVVLGALYKTLDSLHFTKRDVAKIQNSLTDYINVRHNEPIEEKLRVNAAIKAKKRR